jgi:hypothetical protein
VIWPGTALVQSDTDTAGTHEYVLVESGTLRLTEVWSGWLVLTTRRRSGC